MISQRKSLLGIRELSSEEILEILDASEPFKEVQERPIKKVPALRGITVVNLFFENSTRTRSSFELAEKRLSADVLNFSVSQSSVAKGESLRDTAQNIEAMNANMIVMRHPSPGACHFLDRHVDARVINAGDGQHEHPTQALLDAVTLREKLGRIEGTRIVILGDVEHSRVARSNIFLLTKLGAKVTVCGPPTMLPPEITKLGVECTTDVRAALRTADAVNVLRIQFERQNEALIPSIREYARYFGLSEEKVAERESLVVLHPGPMNRDTEIAHGVAEAHAGTILRQVSNGVAVRMAVLYLLSGGGGRELKLLIRGGRVIDPATQHDDVADVLLENGAIVGVERNLAADDARIVDARGLVVAPGLVDMHVHFREPGFEYKEDIASGSRAAARGGFTAVACMPNTNPVLDTEGAVAQVIHRGNEVGLCRVHPIAAITKGQKGCELSEMQVLSEAGAVGFSDDGFPVESARVLRRALEYANFTGRPIISHCEEKTLAAGGHMHEGVVSLALGIPGMPGAAEDLGVARDVRLAEMTRGRLHVCHVSTARSVEVIRQAKERGVRVTAEAAPHHFTLTDEAVEGFDVNAKMNPPLRPESDRQAVLAGLADGTLDVIATDHAPHAAREKLVEFDRAPFGIIGLETSLPLSLEVLRRETSLDLMGILERMTTIPSRLLGLEGGSLRPGAAADLVLFDPEEEWTLTAADLGSKARNTPFLGRRMTGRVRLTLLGGRATWESPAMRARLAAGAGGRTSAGALEVAGS